MLATHAMTRLSMMLLLLASAAVARGQTAQPRILRGHEGAVRLTFSPDGKFLTTASDDQTIKIWDVATAKLIRTLEGSGGLVRQVAYSSDGSLFASAVEDRIHLWTAGGAKIRELAGHEDTVQAVAFSPDGRLLASGSRDETVRFWDVATGRQVRKLQIPRGGEMAEIVWSVAFSPQGNTLAVGSGDGAGGGEASGEVPSGQEATGDGGRGEGHVRVAAVPAATILKTFKASGAGQVRSVAFSPDGQLLAAGTFLDGVITLRQTDNWGVARQWETGGTLRSLAFSPDGQRIAAAVDREMFLFDAASGRQLRKFVGHEDFVVAVAFSPDGSLLASGGSDGTARLWPLR